MTRIITPSVSSAELATAVTAAEAARDESVAAAGSTGYFALATHAALRAVATASGATGAASLRFVRTGAAVEAWQLRAGSDTDDDKTILRPNDYNASTNAYVWVLRNVTRLGVGVTNGWFVGDSIANGSAASTAKSYPYLVAQRYGLANKNLSWGGANVTAYNRFVYPGWTNPNTGSIATAVDSPAAITASDFVHLWGDYNGMRDYGNVAAYQLHHEMAMRSVMLYAAIPDTAKIMGQSSNATKTGTWSNLSNYGGVMGVSSETSNDTVAFTAKGSSVYVTMLNYSAAASPYLGGTSGLPAGTGSVFEVLIDGVSQGQFQNYLAYGNRYAYQGSATYENEAIDYCGWAYRFDGLRDGTHAVVVKVISGLTARPVSFLWGGGSGAFLPDDGAGPVVVLENTMRPVVAGGAGLTTETLINTAIGAFHAIQGKLAREARRDGLRVALADTTPFYLTSNVSGDNVHPTDAGHLELAQATFAALALDSSATNRAGDATWEIGELLEALVDSGSAVSLTTATTANVTSLTLTAGDWEVSGTCGYKLTSATVSAFIAGLSTTSATLGAELTYGKTSVSLTTSTDFFEAESPRQPVKVPVGKTTTVFLISRAYFSAGTVGGFGKIRARRWR